MHIINLTPLVEGVYNDHSSDSITAPPDGWAYIPEDFELPSTFPRLGNITAKEVTYTREVEHQKEVTKERDTGMVDEDGNHVMETYTETETVTEPVEYTMMTVTAMTEGTLPEPVPEPDPTHTMEERVSDIEEQLIQADETAIVLYESLQEQETINIQQDEALVDADETAINMYESQQEQETINAQQDEALMEIYEMLG